MDPSRLLEQEIYLLRLRRPDLRVAGVPGPATQVLAAPDQLQRALANLLDNAATATPPGGTIEVRTVVRDAGRLAIRIIDAGPGVPPADRERIFDRFVRLSNSRGGYGTGLGLPISRAIVRADGGALRCVPWEGGACFEVELPIAAHHSGASHSPWATADRLEADSHADAFVRNG